VCSELLRDTCTDYNCISRETEKAVLSRAIVRGVEESEVRVGNAISVSSQTGREPPLQDATSVKLGLVKTAHPTPDVSCSE
jgi:hypothetical protein